MSHYLLHSCWKDTWYFSPLPKELLKDGNMIEVLYVCEFTLQFFTRKVELRRFQRKHLPKNKRHPPGNGEKHLDRFQFYNLFFFISLTFTQIQRKMHGQKFTEMEI